VIIVAVAFVCSCKCLAALALPQTQKSLKSPKGTKKMGKKRPKTQNPNYAAVSPARLENYMKIYDTFACTWLSTFWPVG